MLDSNDPRAAYLHQCIDGHLQSLFGNREPHENYFGIRAGIGNFSYDSGPVANLEMLGPFGKHTDGKTAGNYHAKHFKMTAYELITEMERHLKERGCEIIGYFDARNRIARRQQQTTTPPAPQEESAQVPA